MQGITEIVTNVQHVLHNGVHSPQAETARQLIQGVDGGSALMDPKWPLIGVALYLSCKEGLKTICKQLGTNGKSRTFKLFALVHNIAICVFSLITSIKVWQTMIDHVRQYGYENAFCDSKTWEAGLNFWSFLFYLSKYWELIDSYLLVWKRRSPSFLQVYHHAVTIICAYLLHASRSPVTFVFVGFNATVHTVMYAYYALTIVGIRLSGKSLITVMQIVQFIVGNVLAAASFILRDGACIIESQKVAIGSTIAHAFILIFLFVNFFRQTYITKAAKTKLT